MDTLVGGEPSFRGGLRKVADGVHAWLQPNGSWGESNAALVVGEGESLLVDTLWTPTLTRRMLERMARHTKAAPITTVFNTHGDGDHWWGNQELAGAEIIATEQATADMEEITPAKLGQLDKLAGGLRLAGRSPLPWPGRGHARALGRYVGGMLGPYDFSDVRPTPPTRSFSGRLDIEVGGRRVELIEVGPAHTFGDGIGLVPDARTVIAADVLFIGVTPVMWAGPISSWLAALDRILELDPEVIVPGHGPPTDAAGVRELQAYLRYVDAAARRRFADGATPARAGREILASDEFAATPYSAWIGPERLAITLRTIARGEPRPVSPLERMRIFAETAGLA